MKKRTLPTEKVSASTARPVEAGKAAQKIDASVTTARGHDTPAGKVVPFAKQQYAAIRDECVRSRKLFEDPEFPAADATLFFTQRPQYRFEWKRPPELVKDAKFVVGGASRFDVAQGELGDCWLLAAVASLSMNSELFNKVVPPDQDFDSQYGGIFHFRFWQFGNWTDVVIDDRLPTVNGRLVFLHSPTGNEFWSALLEKAYAKLMGSYEALKGGSQCEAMEDFTGGVTELIDLGANQPANLFEIMLKANQRSSLMGCSIDANPNVVEARLANGLIMGHAYSVTDVKMVDITVSGKSGKVPLVRVRNPWGNEAEWNGAWSDKSREWSCVSDSERRQLGLTFDSDGEFWMSFKDFASNFQRLEICHLGPESLENDELSGKQKHRYEEIVINGAWQRRVNAGGCRNYIDTFWTNPQYRVKVVDPDDDDKEDMGTLIVGLMQKDRRKKRKEGLDYLTIGYSVYKLKGDEADGPLDINFFKRNVSCAKAPSFINLREVCGRHKLPPGEYIIVPCTFEPNQEADYLVRLFSEKQHQAAEMDQKTDIQEVPQAKDAVPALDPRAEQAIRDAFVKVAGTDMEVDAYELKEILDSTFKKDFKFGGFSLEACRSMVALLDVDLSGKLGLDEFKLLWKNMSLYKAAMSKFDTDKTGTLNATELREALKSLGFTVSNRTFNCLVLRYSDKKGDITFDDFVLMAVRLRTCIESFKAHPKDNKGDATFNVDTFIQTLLYV